VEKGGTHTGDRSLARRAHKIHALTDGYCRPIAFLLTGGKRLRKRLCTAPGAGYEVRVNASVTTTSTRHNMRGISVHLIRFISSRAADDHSHSTSPKERAGDTMN
jgi:hypothetical protein